MSPTQDEILSEGWLPVYHLGGPVRLALLDSPPCGGIGLYIRADLQPKDRLETQYLLQHDGRPILEEGSTLSCGRCGGDLSSDLQTVISELLATRRSAL